MPSISSETIRRLRAPGYLVMTMLTALPVVELVATVFPLQLHVAAWRFTMIGAAVPAAITALLGLYFIYAIAVAAGDSAVLWIVSSICGVGAVLCLGAAGLFPLDALQVKGQVPAQAMSRYVAASAVAMVKVCVATVVYTGLAISSFRAASRVRSDTVRERGTGSPFVVGTATARTGNG